MFSNLIDAFRKAFRSVEVASENRCKRPGRTYETAQPPQLGDSASYFATVSVAHNSIDVFSTNDAAAASAHHICSASSHSDTGSTSCSF